jgi:hypothetical protein
MIMTIRIAAVCGTEDCQAVHLTQLHPRTENPYGIPLDVWAARHAERAGWRASYTEDGAPTTHCPSCAHGGPKVLDRGECVVCLGKTADHDDAKVCIYCTHREPYPAEDWDLLPREDDGA